MEKFGVFKTKVLANLTENYGNEQFNSSVKKYFNPIMEDEELKELYLFYESIESKTFNDRAMAEIYVNELSNHLKGKKKKLSNKLTQLVEGLNNDVEINPIYEALDVLTENDNLSIIENKISAKQTLIEHFLLEKNQQDQEIIENYTNNEALLVTMLTNNFNYEYKDKLTEEEQTRLKTILCYSQEELSNEFNTIKENVLIDINQLISESNDNDLTNQLLEVKTEITGLSISKLNLVRIEELKSNLTE